MLGGHPAQWPARIRRHTPFMFAKGISANAKEIRRSVCIVLFEARRQRDISLKTHCDGLFQVIDPKSFL